MTADLGTDHVRRKRETSVVIVAVGGVGAALLIAGAFLVGRHTAERSSVVQGTPSTTTANVTSLTACREALTKADHAIAINDEYVGVLVSLMEAYRPVFVAAENLYAVRGSTYSPAYADLRNLNALAATLPAAERAGTAADGRIALFDRKAQADTAYLTAKLACGPP